MPSGVYKRRPRPASVRAKISRTMRTKKVSNRNGRPQYPWNKWFASNRVKVVLVKGVDFTCSVPMMRQSICNRASERGISVDNEIEGKTITVHITRKAKRSK